MTHPFPLLESSLTPSRMPKPNARKTSFSKQKVLFQKTYYRVSINILDYPSRRIAGSFFRNNHGSASEMNYWTTLQGNSSENLPLKFLSQLFSIFLFFHFLSCHALTPNILGCPGAYGMHCAISKQFMQHMPIYDHAYIDKIHILIRAKLGVLESTIFIS